MDYSPYLMRSRGSCEKYVVLPFPLLYCNEIPLIPRKIHHELRIVGSINDGSLFVDA